MKKIFYCIVFFILLNISFDSFASQLPMVPGSTELATAQQFTTDVASTLFTSLTNYESGTDPYTLANRGGFSPIGGGTYFAEIDWEYKNLNSLDWVPSQPVWDNEGNQVSFSNVGLCTGSNSGQYTYFLYSLNTGEMLNIGDTYESSISSLNTNANNNFPQMCYQIQGQLGSVDDPTNTNPLAVYNADTITSTKLEWLKELPQSSYAYGVDPDKGSFGIFLVCNVPGVVVNTSNAVGSSDVPHFAMNDGYEAYLSYYGYGSYTYGNFPLRVSNERQTINNINYKYAIPPNGANSFAAVQVGLITGSIHNTPWFSVPSEDISDVGFVTPVQSITDPVNTQEPVNYTYYINRPVTRNNTYNNTFNPSYDYSVNNYPINYNYTYPSYNPTYNYYNDYYSSTLPGIGGDIGQVDPDNITDNIPILNNLSKRFPFSIPFDIYNMIQGLSIQREAPHFEWELYFPVIDYTWEVDFDLAIWNSQAGIFRTCFLILFIIGLAMWSYNHFFGN